jgi:ribosomal protein S18 acetylase RimI-like enzyme
VSRRRNAAAIRVVRVRAKYAVWVAQAAAPLFEHPADVPALRKYLSDSRNIFLLAVDHGTAIGFLRGTKLDQIHTRHPQMFLYEVGVAPSHRRRGVGRALVEGFLQHCRRLRCDEAFVFTDPQNRPAVALYRSTGAVTETPRDRMFVYRLKEGKRDRPRRGEAAGAPRASETARD